MYPNPFLSLAANHAVVPPTSQETREPLTFGIGPMWFGIPRTDLAVFALGGLAMAVFAETVKPGTLAQVVKGASKYLAR